jgi:DivIVA domain-containing protein
VSQAYSHDQQGLLDLISQARFGETRLRPGYVKADVHAFLDEVRATVAGMRQPPLTPRDVRAVQFRTTRLHAGYDEEDVDGLLDRIEEALRRTW